MDNQDYIQDLLERAQELPHGLERLALVDEAVRAADLAQDGMAGYERPARS